MPSKRSRCPAVDPRGAHAIQRARERYGLTLTLDDLRVVEGLVRAADQATARHITCLQLRPDHARQLQKGGARLRRCAWLVWWAPAREWLLVIYCYTLHVVATFLPLGAEFTDDGEMLPWKENAE